MSAADGDCVRVLCFGVLRDRLGHEHLLPASLGDVAAVWVALTRHAADLAARRDIRPTRNLAYCSWHDPVEAGDEVAFLPPACGG